jgi:hypothetical protein
MNIKSLFATLAFCAVAMPAANATVISMRATGIVSYGFDQLGLFGDAGRELTGKAFSQTFSMELDTAQLYIDPYIERAEQTDAYHPMFISTTIDGVTAIQSVTSGWRFMSMSKWISTDYGRADTLHTGAYGADTETGGRIDANLGGTNFGDAPVGANDTLTSTISLTPNASFGQALEWNYTVGNFMSRIYTDRLTVVELNPRDSGSVPEPATAGLFAIGLLGAAMARRRKQH